jgi:hypothetical protein
MRLRPVACCVCFFWIAMLASRSSMAAEQFNAVSRSPENQGFQFMASASFTYPGGKPRTATAYLWIPEQCQRVRGILVMGRNVPEHWLVGHPAIRQACSDSDLAILWSCPSFFDPNIKDGKHHGQCLQQLLSALAAQSGYEELATVPWLPIGESMHLQMVLQLVGAYPERCIAGVQVKNGFLNPPAVGVPMLLAVGTCDEWDQEKKDLLNQWKDVSIYERLQRQREKTPLWPCSLVIEPGSGHFECTETMGQYIAQYIRAVARARFSPDGNPALRAVNLNAGYVTSLPVPGAKELPPTRCEQCPAESRSLPWYFDADLAKSARAIATTNWDAQTQIPAFADTAGKPIPFGYRGIFSPVPYATAHDGITIQLNAAFLDRIPDNFKRGGTPLGHAARPPAIEWICGHVIPLSNNRFQICLDRTWPNSPTFLRVWHPGDETYRPSVQPGELKITPNRTGRPQTITFDAIPDQPRGAKEVRLHATSDAGLLVRLFVRCGPAEIQGDRLVFTPIPPRSRKPVTVTVAAWQWGRSSEPAIQTAEMAERSFKIAAND